MERLGPALVVWWGVTTFGWLLRGFGGAWLVLDVRGVYGVEAEKLVRMVARYGGILGAKLDYNLMYIHVTALANINVYKNDKLMITFCVHMISL